MLDLISLALALLLPIPPIAQTDAPRPPVVVVEGDFLGPDGDGLRAESAKYFAAVTRALELSSVAFEKSQDSTVEKWGLPQSCRVALFPYNRAISAGELANIRAFIGRGGKVIPFYVGPDELLVASGVRPGSVVSSEEPGQFGQMILHEGRLPGAPDGVTQTSWNVRGCEPLPQSVTIANWASAAGADSGLPAVVLGQGGAFMSHVFTPGDDYRKGQLLRAIIGHFVPEIWPGVARAELDQLNAVGKFGSLKRLIEHLENRRRLGHQVDVPLAAAQRAVALRDQALVDLHDDRAIAAVDAATGARAAAMQAFWATYPSKPGELRGVWCIYRGRPTWEATMANLAAANFNAIMPRFASAGVAYYPSAYLPLGDYAKENGDQIAQACAAGQKYGIPVHARMLALFVYESSDSIKQEYRNAGRLQVSTKGKVSSTWLCPSHPENRNLVINVCMEMATKYPVAGIQLDYIRYDGREWCYCRTCKATFQRDAGVTVDSWPSDCYSGKYRGRFADWRREQINSIMRELRARLKAYNPATQFSADVFVNWEGHRVSFGQDWKVWVDEGLCDFVCPMDYFGKDEDFIKWVTLQRGWIRDDVPMCVGLGPRVKQTALTPEHMLEQIEMSRNLGGDGIVLFDYDEIMA
ncbi:MAG TPA: family 10 glycosylhydrolase, partial [Armatimonadota bacterium]|nr:family 10 glycosylhydrolase [Armatimonadota bacterium]